MSAQRMVIALGGNALGNSPEEQLRLISTTAQAIVDLIEEGHQVIITHGNGPQVGMLKVATDYSAQHGGGTPAVPFPECSAMSQGYIGYHLQQALENELSRRGMDYPCASVITQTVVAASDPAFENLTKPVGGFYTKEEAARLAAETGHCYVEDSGRGWRRVVASPQPRRIVESSVIEGLVESGTVVISAGGGGIPVVEGREGLTGVAAVIDKDRCAAVIAEQVHADVLVILTAVERVALDFHTPQQRDLTQLSAAKAHEYIEAGQFAPGSMLPKVESCLQFVEGHPRRKAIITSLACAKEALSGTTGTVVTA
ncbi:MULTISPECIES: carbamate kinase [unclassified Corynebacterium]|uniref:carbamate kinase n=1 Tax=unclassified Corynebacterium TaxID=2624378 RepID=UPI0029CA7724|nr:MULTISPECIES: carbamate kinase [unclassified Corynebacterium]WPF66862.1 carbamate kinase [Corynebacterium sp. 22KM0430]WPF69350.1 carbamate kinase [Corynebacterium sp. 21KM1197]